MICECPLIKVSPANKVTHGCKIARSYLMIDYLATLTTKGFHELMEANQIASFSRFKLVPPLIVDSHIVMKSMGPLYNETRRKLQLCYNVQAEGRTKLSKRCKTIDLNSTTLDVRSGSGEPKVVRIDGCLWHCEYAFLLFCVLSHNFGKQTPGATRLEI